MIDNMDLGRWKVAELKNALIARGLDTKGFKSALVERLQAAVSESDDNNDKANPKTSNDEEEVKEEIPSSLENWEHSINSDNDETNEEHRELIIIPLRETYSKNIKARIQLFAGKR